MFCDICTCWLNLIVKIVGFDNVSLTINDGTSEVLLVRRTIFAYSGGSPAILRLLRTLDIAFEPICW